ncbi:hypothetical protein BGZ97_007843, partial [Linnemannia gamsii]
ECLLQIPLPRVTLLLLLLPLPPPPLLLHSCPSLSMSMSISMLTLTSTTTTALLPPQLLLPLHTQPSPSIHPPLSPTTPTIMPFPGESPHPHPLIVSS